MGIGHSGGSCGYAVVSMALMVLVVFWLLNEILFYYVESQNKTTDVRFL